MDNEEESQEETSCQIIHLPECVLRVLFSYLDSTTLYQLTQTCSYFKYFINDPIFWRYIDARSSPNTNDKVQYCSDRIHGKTTHVFLKAKDKKCGIVPHNFFKAINGFTNIKVLALEYQRFHGSQLTLKHFPSGLEELSLKGTNIKSSMYFFQHSGQNMQKLKVLILDQCQWVTCSFLMAVAKYVNLEIISAVKCMRLHLNMVPYLNVARYGCEKLKVFDCRFTNIGHELLRTFYPKESLQALYFQSLKSTEVDYNKCIFNRKYMRTEPAERPREGDNGICDESLFEYINSSACDITDKIPNSILYKDPYPECTCTYKKGDSRTPPLISFNEYSICTSPQRKSIKFVCSRHIQDVEKLSDNFRDFFLSNQHQFYADMKASEVESETESSDSESDDNYGNCCMYGMGRSMILLTPGENPGSVQEQVLEYNRDEQQQGRVVSIFISTPMRERATASYSYQNVQPSPSTSRGSNENASSSRNKAKRPHSEDVDDPQPSPSKRLKMSHDLDSLNDEAKAAEASELIRSSDEVQENLNNFVERTMEFYKNDTGVAQKGDPTTSRAPDRETEGDNSKNKPPQDVQSTSAGVSSTSDTTEAAVSNLKTRIKIGLSRASNLLQSRNNDNSQGRQGESEPSSHRSYQNRVAREGESSRQQQIGVNIPRTAIITIRNRERSRYVNPLFVQIENKHVKKKSRLRRLSLRGFRRITDVGLDYIKNLKLDLLDLTYTSVTKEGIENFLAYNPNCRVIHPLYCVCKPTDPF